MDEFLKILGKSTTAAAAAAAAALATNNNNGGDNQSNNNNIVVSPPQTAAPLLPPPPPLAIIPIPSSSNNTPPVGAKIPAAQQPAIKAAVLTPAKSFSQLSQQQQGQYFQIGIGAELKKIQKSQLSPQEEACLRFIYADSNAKEKLAGYLLKFQQQQQQLKKQQQQQQQQQQQAIGSPMITTVLSSANMHPPPGTVSPPMMIATIAQQQFPSTLSNPTLSKILPNTAAAPSPNIAATASSSSSSSSSSPPVTSSLMSLLAATPPHIPSSHIASPAPLLQHLSPLPQSSIITIPGAAAPAAPILPNSLPAASSSSTTAVAPPPPPPLSSSSSLMLNISPALRAHHSTMALLELVSDLPVELHQRVQEIQTKRIVCPLGPLSLPLLSEIMINNGGGGKKHAYTYQ